MSQWYYTLLAGFAAFVLVYAARSKSEVVGLFFGLIGAILVSIFVAEMLFFGVSAP